MSSQSFKQLDSVHTSGALWSREWLGDWARGPGYPLWTPSLLEYNHKTYVVVTNRAAMLFMRTAMRTSDLDYLVGQHRARCHELLRTPRQVSKRVNLKFLRAWAGTFHPKWVEHPECGGHGCAYPHCVDGLIENVRGRARPARFFGSVEVDLNLLAFALRYLPGLDVAAGMFEHGGHSMFVLDNGSDWRLVIAGLVTVREGELIDELWAS